MKPLFNGSVIATLVLAFSATAFALCPTAVGGSYDPGGNCNATTLTCSQPKKNNDGNCDGPNNNTKACKQAENTYRLHNWKLKIVNNCDGGCIDNGQFTDVNVNHAWNDGNCVIL